MMSTLQPENLQICFAEVDKDGSSSKSPIAERAHQTFDHLDLRNQILVERWQESRDELNTRRLHALLRLTDAV